MQAGLASTVKWTKMNVFLTHARMEGPVTIWWMGTGVLARRALKVKTKVHISISPLLSFHGCVLHASLLFPSFFWFIHSKHDLNT